jgi:hypothetical protein
MVDFNPNLDDTIRDFVIEFVEPEKRGKALVLLQSLKKDAIKSVQHKLDNYMQSFKVDIDRNVLA